jgi:hypothetical protein
LLAERDPSNDYDGSGAALDALGDGDADDDTDGEDSAALCDVDPEPQPVANNAATTNTRPRLTRREVSTNS